MTLWRSAKAIAKRVAPGPFLAAKRVRAARQFRLGHGGAEYRAKRALVAHYGLRVIAGPFAGMAYGHDVNCGAYVAKLVGSYEQELHWIVERVIETAYGTVVDVGCAEGYYAVGLARRMGGALVYAFDVDGDSRRYCRSLARRNGVANRVRIGGHCGHSQLAALCGPGTIVVCDCEGYEADLLDPAAVDRLAETDVLVELHERLRPGVTRLLLDRFEATHDVELVDTTDRSPGDYPQLADVPEADRPWAVREGRGGPMQWGWMKAKRPGDAAD